MSRKITISLSTLISLIVLLAALAIYNFALQWQPVLLVDGYAPNRIGIARYIDEEADVICWTFNGLIFGGISCLPYEDTGF
jgi:hypothetical protein